MPNSLELVKRAALDAVEASKPVYLMFGQVISASPLKIQVDQKVTLTETMLILTRSVTDYEVDMTVAHTTEEKAGGAGDAAFMSHSHDYIGRKKFKVHNALVEGDQVVMARVQRGKKYIVLDRIKPNPALKGEWV